MDKARQRTDKRLKNTEKSMSRVYKTNPALVSIIRKYNDYMGMVEKRTRSLYMAFRNETDIDKRQEAKEAYQRELEALTVKSKKYQDIIDEFVTILAQVNQEALNIINAQMLEVYVDNYNEVANECRKAGIKVNG